MNSAQLLKPLSILGLKLTLDSRKIVQNWFTYAVRDLKAAQGLRTFGSEQKNTVAFHCQQCVEKAIKGFLVSYGKRPPKTHSILELTDMVEEYDAKLAAKLKKANKFTRYAVVFRYPDAEKKPLTMREVDSALKLAKKLYDEVVASAA